MPVSTPAMTERGPSLAVPTLAMGRPGSIGAQIAVLLIGLSVPATVLTPAPALSGDSIPEAGRMEIFGEVVGARNRALRESAERSRGEPESVARLEAQNQLVARYVAEVGTRHGLSPEELERIEEEGYRRGWPFPSLVPGPQPAEAEPEEPESDEP